MGNHWLVMSFFSVGNSPSKTMAGCMNDGFSNAVLCLVQACLVKVRGCLNRHRSLSFDITTTS
jgi:hypothetical protein